MRFVADAHQQLRAFPRRIQRNAVAAHRRENALDVPLRAAHAVRFGNANHVRRVRFDERERVFRRVKLPLAAIHHNHVRHRQAFIHDPRIPARDDFLHHAEIVAPFNRFDAKPLVFFRLHHAIHAHNHRADRQRPLNVGNVETLNPARQIGKVKLRLEFLQPLQRGGGFGLVVFMLAQGDFGILPRHFDQLLFPAALRNNQGHLFSFALRQPFLNHLLIRNRVRQQDFIGNQHVFQIKLLHDGAQHVAFRKDVKAFRVALRLLGK